MTDERTVWVCPTCGATDSWPAARIDSPICTAEHRHRDQNRLMIPLRPTGGDAA